jgi:hypothetical protein
MTDTFMEVELEDGTIDRRRYHLLREQFPAIGTVAPNSWKRVPTHLPNEVIVWRIGNERPLIVKRLPT